MWKEIKNWWSKTFETKYIIVRNKMIRWHLFYKNRSTIKYALAQSELLSEVHFINKFKFSKRLKKAYTASGVWSFLLMKVLIKWHGKKYKYKRIKEGDAVFVTDLTGLTRN